MLSPLSWLTVFPELYMRFSSTNSNYWTTDWHYNANLEPFLAVSAVLVIDKYKLPQKAVMLLLIFMIFFMGGLSPSSLIWTTFQLRMSDVSSFNTLNLALQKIPSSASVSAQSPIVPHLINRPEIYLYPDVSDAKYIVLDQQINSYPLTPQQLADKITSLEKSKTWQEIENVQGVVIFKRLKNLSS